VDGKELVFIHSQDTPPIIESAKAIASSADPSVAWRRNGFVHIARIPMPEWSGDSCSASESPTMKRL
jgi:hypothetical protein